MPSYSLLQLQSKQQATADQSVELHQCWKQSSKGPYDACIRGCCRIQWSEKRGEEEIEKGIRRQRESFPGNDSSSRLPSLTFVYRKKTQIFKRDRK